MSAVSAPFGLRPAYSPSGIIRPTAYSIANAYAANLLAGQPVTIAADGTLTATPVGGRSIGAFQGVEYSDMDGRRRVSNKWIANTPVLPTGDPTIAYATLDPSIVYEIQANGPLSISDIGSQANTTVIGSGSLIVGNSAMMLDVATLTNTGNGTFRIIGIAIGPDNAPGDAFTIAQVQIAQHQNVADRIAY